MWRRHLLVVIGLFAALTALPSLALDRPFPAHAKRGTMTSAPYPDIVIDGKRRQLAPGGRIRNENNLIEVPASLHDRETLVNYTEDGQGLIDRVWILTAEEARRPLAQQTNSQP